MANGFSVGDLNLSISASATDTLKYLDAVVERLDFINKGLGGIKGVTKNTPKKSSSSSGFLGFAKLGLSLHTMRRIGRVMGNIVQAGSDYTETLNLWQVAMRGNLDMADKFVNKIQKAYGISSTTVMNAQATFKNMIGSLGQISDETAYKLSETLVQMSADFSSLYNVQLESAVQKMQSMLAGQVRPIRSAGLDMTETTLYQFYQELGGQKSMRQLNRTEKQLLSILAVFRQMESAGALGDMTKTLNSFANQSRMMVEYWKELKTWAGLLVKDLIESSGLLVKINALLIVSTEIIKAIAKSRGADDENFIDTMFESTENTIDALDELQGKLLGFDQFRSLEGDGGVGDIEIDEKLLKAITGYSSQIDQAQNEAQKLAGYWLNILGFTKDANDEFAISEGRLDRISNVFEAITYTVGILIGYKLAGWLLKVREGATLSSIAFSVLNTVILGGTIYAILLAIDAFERGEYLAGILATAVGVVLAGAFILLHKKAIKTAIVSIGKFITSMLLVTTLSTGSFALGIASLTAGFIGLSAAIVGAFLLIKNWGDMSTWQKIVGIIGIATTAILGLALAFGVFHSAWSIGLATAGIVAGIGAMVAAFATIKKEVPKVEDTSSLSSINLDSSTMDIANSIGLSSSGDIASYANSSIPSSKSVGNSSYLGTKSALDEWWAHAKYDIPQLKEANPTGMYEAVTNVAGARGNKWSKV
jgi:hypothetical protein